MPTKQKSAPISKGFCFILEVTHYSEATILELQKVVREHLGPNDWKTVKAFEVQFEDGIVTDKKLLL